MVTFSIPGEEELAEAGKSTPRPRPALPFAKRAYVSTPFKPSRLGTPQSAPARRLLTTRDEIPKSSLNQSSLSTARNIFRASAISDSPPTTPFSPSLPQSTMKKVFAPGVTPEPNRVYRASTAHVTPRGMAAKTTSKELFPMRIADPDPELSGEAITKKIPKDWQSKSSIYADQFLSHLCPPEFDDEQRRQFFCILDLRRLKYAANEIFSNKDWKLNVINFAKEFEKSRSIILLRYGLYEFQKVKPSKEVLKRWRREHGLPEPEDEAGASPTPTKATASKKRKANDDVSKDGAAACPSSSNKRRAPDPEEEIEETQRGTPAPSALNKNKRKASVSDETESQPSKMQKATPSAAKSLFEKIANKSSTPAGSPAKPTTKPADETAAAKPSPFAASKINGTSGGLARSVFQNLKPGNAPAAANIFGYLSDASSAKNSGVDADAESEADSDAEESQATGHSDEPSAAASGADTASQTGAGLFGLKPAPISGQVADSSAPGTRESTPGRSLFERVTKGTDGQPVRADGKSDAEAPEKPAARPADQTWNPTTTPIKFAPSAPASQTGSLFGASSAAPTSSLFASKSTSSNLFGAAKQDKPAEKESTPASEQTDKTGGESDKENDEAPKKSLFESKAPAAQPNLGTSLFQSQAAGDTSVAEPAKSTSGLFGQAPKEAESVKSSDEPSAAPASNIFGSLNKPADGSDTALQSSTLFGAKPTDANKPAADAPKTSLFGASNATSTGGESAPAPSLFGAKPTSTAGNLFGNASSTPASKPLFGAPSSDTTAPKTDAAPKPTAAPIFSFGAPSAGTNGISDSAKPLFGAPKSPSAPNTTLFGGSPMKQDGPPAKKAFNGGSTGGPPSATPTFSFGGGSNASSAPLFGGASTAPPDGNNAATSFGSNQSSGTGGFSFNFGGGGAPSGPTGGSAASSFNNPFASANNGNNSGSAQPSPAPGGMFSFGGNTTQTSGSGSFPFGGASSGNSAPAFGSAPANNGNSTPMFGGASGSGSAPSFSFTGASPAQNSAPTFGSGQPAPAFGNLQPPAGGSTTGTSKSPLTRRKILPLKRRS